MFVKHLPEIGAMIIAIRIETTMQVLCSLKESPQFGKRCLELQVEGGMLNHVNLIGHAHYVLNRNVEWRCFFSSQGLTLV